MIDVKSEELTGRELLIRVSLRLFMDRGYDGVSMQQIASAANMTKGSPYYHFKGKEDLFLHVYATHMRETNASLIRTLETEAPLRERLGFAFRYILESFNIGTLRLIDDAQRLFKEQLESVLPIEDAPPVVMRRVYQQAFESSEIELRASPVELADMLIALQMGTMQTRIMLSEGSPIGGKKSELAGSVMAETPEQLATRMIDVFLCGVVVNPNPQ